MLEDDVAAAADLLAAAWSGRGDAILPQKLMPRDLAEGTKIQDALAQRLGIDHAGWKLGLTSAAGQTASGFDRPFTGRVYRSLVKRSPAVFPDGSFRKPLIEAEFAFRMASALPPRDAPYAEMEVLDAVASAFIGIEVADSRYAGPWPFPMPLLAADNGAAGGFVIGPDVPDWRGRDLSAIEVTLEINGRHAAGNLTGPARTDAVAALVWAANDLSRRGFGLRAEELVTTGSAATPTPCGSSSRVVARFAGIGEVQAAL